MRQNFLPHCFLIEPLTPKMRGYLHLGYVPQNCLKFSSTLKCCIKFLLQPVDFYLFFLYNEIVQKKFLLYILKEEA